MGLKNKKLNFFLLYFVLTSEPAELALECPAQVLDFVPVVDGQEVAAHLRVLGLGPALPAAPPELRTTPALLGATPSS